MGLIETTKGGFLCVLQSEPFCLHFFRRCSFSGSPASILQTHRVGEKIAATVGIAAADMSSESSGKRNGRSVASVRRCSSDPSGERGRRCSGKSVASVRKCTGSKFNAKGRIGTGTLNFDRKCSVGNPNGARTEIGRHNAGSSSAPKEEIEITTVRRGWNKCGNAARLMSGNGATAGLKFSDSCANVTTGLAARPGRNLTNSGVSAQTDNNAKDLKTVVQVTMIVKDKDLSADAQDLTISSGSVLKTDVTI